MKKKLVIIGASYLQVPLAEKANSMGIETHVFAWEEDAVARDYADYFYPISIRAKEEILKKCKEIQPDGIISISSDLAMITVNYVSQKLGLVGNSMQSTYYTTHKYAMRNQLRKNELPCPKYFNIKPSTSDATTLISSLGFPLIIKPTDRSGSRGISKVNHYDEIQDSLNRAYDVSFNNSLIAERFIVGKEYSIETISWKGEHTFLAFTEKKTSGTPYFVEIEQHQPAEVNPIVQRKAIKCIKKSLTALGISFGASHSEIIVGKNDEVFIVEIGARMGGDHIGTDLVKYSTGFDYVKGVIEIALGIKPEVSQKKQNVAGIYYITPKAGKVMCIIDNTSKYSAIKKTEIFVCKGDKVKYPVTNSSERSAYFVYCGDERFKIENPDSIIKIITSEK